MGVEASPHYQRIAIDIAAQIAEGELKEGQRISGRSLLASEYGVSPETIRRSLRLLADIKAVEIRDKRGVVILSADNAKRFLQEHEGLSTQQDLLAKLKDLFAKYHDIGKQMQSVYSMILETQEHPLATDRNLPNYEVRVSDTSRLIGKSIGSLHFWQHTGATIVAIKRKQSTIISPGPFAELYGGDIIVFVCKPAAVKTVRAFVNGGKSAQDDT